MTNPHNLTNLRKNTYNSILTIIDQLIKIVYFKLITTIIDTSGLTELIIDVVIELCGLLILNVNNRGFFLILKFRLLF